ncbi:MAG: hypothetical protein H6R22_495 [Chromatiaceae bacterium]|jgi:hypothetical protein|nr:hypothetical protein [Chromatiaceae bacterium]
MKFAVKSYWSRRVRLAMSGLSGDDLIEILANLAWLA